jgi:hypothetical protein
MRPVSGECGPGCLPPILSRGKACGMCGAGNLPEPGGAGAHERVPGGRGADIRGVFLISISPPLTAGKFHALV